MAKTKEIELADLDKDAKHVYVINNTKTDISITVKDEDGTYRLIRILRASIPQDAAEVVSAAILKKTANFKRAVSSGYITIVSEDYASQVLNRPESKVELAALKKKLSRIPPELMVDTQEQTPLEAISGTATDGTIRSEIKDISLDTEESSDDKLARLIMLDKEQPISGEEKTWLISRLSSNYADVIAWLNKK